MREFLGSRERERLSEEAMLERQMPHIYQTESVNKNGAWKERLEIEMDYNEDGITVWASLKKKTFAKISRIKCVLAAFIFVAI